MRSARRLARLDTLDPSRFDQPPGVPDTLAVVLSAAAFVLAFPLPDLGFVAWVALVPLFVAARHRSPRTAFWLGYVWGLVAYGGVLWWITAFGPGVWAVVALLGAVFPALAMLATAWVEQDHDGPLVFLWVPLIWTAVEFLRSQGPLGFPWALLGASQHQALAVIQIASLTGVYGVSFLVALVNATLYVLLTRRAIIAPVCGTGLVVLGAVLWGTIALRQPVPAGPGHAGLTAAVVQPNLGARVRWSPDLARHDFVVLDGLTKAAALRGAALVVWPETAAPTDIRGNPATLATIRSWAERDHLSLIASSLEGGRINSAFAFSPSGALTGRYDKVRLVPFAEFGEQAGRAPGVLATPDARIGMAICFESIFPEHARREVREGATLLAVITNDAWFDGRTAPAQHAALAPFRAVEEARYLLRAANSGISAVIDPRGRTLAELPLGVRGILTARIVPRSGLTPYARIGDAFGWAAVLIGAGLLLPRTLAFVEEAGSNGFSRLLVVSALPLAGLGVVEWLRDALLRGGPAVIPLPILAVLVVTALLSLGHPARELGFRVAGFVPAAVLGLAAVAVFGGVALSAFAGHGPAPQLLPPPGGWWWGSAVQVLVVGLALEWWLRGLVFATAEEWRGWKVAVLWSALLGMVAATPRGAEAMVWALCSGLAFGLIRARWAQVPALALAHGAGNVLLGFLLAPW